MCVVRRGLEGVRRGMVEVKGVIATGAGVDGGRASRWAWYDQFLSDRRETSLGINLIRDQFTVALIWDNGRTGITAVEQILAQA